MDPKLLVLLIPALFTFLQLRTKKYVYSALITGSCAVIAAFHAPMLCAALTAAVIGDWFMAHKGKNEVLYLFGIAGFFISHALLIVYALNAMEHHRFVSAALICGVVLAALFSVYLALRVMKKTPKLLQLPVAVYALISISGFACSIAYGNGCYSLGVACLLFSDIMIAENDFVGNKKVGYLILPTYYLCHLLVTLSAML